MHIRSLHEWDVDASHAMEIQNRLHARISLKDLSTNLRGLRRVCGADVSYAPGKETLYGGVVVLSLPGLEVVEERWVEGTVGFPYIPGLLSFREAPILLRAFSLLKHPPDAVIFDGQGIAHPRGLGLASHIGLFLNLPSVGCAKTKLVGEHREVARDKGSWSWLEFKGKKVGAVVRTRENVKPVFVSPGHRMSLQTAVRLVLATSRGYRLPEPTRMADQLVNRLRRDYR